VRQKRKEINFGFLTIIGFAVIICFGCSSLDDYSHMGNVEQSGDMICIVKKRYSAEYRVSRPLSRGELFLRGNAYKSEEFPKLVVRDCSAVNEKMMSLQADDGVYLWLDEEGEVKLKKLNVRSGNLSNDFKWFVTQDKRISPLTGEEIPFKAKLPSEFLGNSPDWKTIITEGFLDEKDFISLYVVDVETGVAKKGFVRRANYTFMLNHAHQLEGIVSNNLWISNHFRWVPDADGKFQLVYPVLEHDEKTVLEKR
jgi:hypothetical protein